MSLDLKEDVMNAVRDSKIETATIRQLEQEYRNRSRATTVKTVDGSNRMDLWLSDDDYDMLRDIRSVTCFSFDKIYSIALHMYYYSHGIQMALGEYDE